MLNAHEVFSDANRKAHLHPHRLSPAEIAADERMAAECAVDLSDEDLDE